MGVLIEEVAGINGKLIARAERLGQMVRYEVEADRRFSKQIYRFGRFDKMRDFLGARSYSSKVGAGLITEKDVLEALENEGQEKRAGR